MSALVLTNMAGYVWSIPATETGINVQKVVCKTMSDKFIVKDNLANTAGRADHDFRQEYDVDGWITASPTAPPGILFVIANMITTNGVLTGALILDDSTITYEPGKPGHIAYKAVRYGSLAANVTQVAT